MDPDADEWGLLSIADVLEGVAPVTVTNETELEYPTNDLFFALDESDYGPAVSQFAQKLMSSLKHESASYTTSIEETFHLRAQKVRQSLGASRRIREKLITAVESFRTSAPSSGQGVNMLGTIALLGAAIGDGDDSAYCDAVLYSISQIDWTHATAASCKEILNSFRFDMGSKFSTEVQQKMAMAKLNLSLRSGTLSSLVQCMLAPESRTVTLPPFCASLPATAGISARSSTHPSSDRFHVNEVKLESFLTRYCAAPASEGSNLTCFPLVAAAGVTGPQAQQGKHVRGDARHDEEGTDCLAVTSSDSLSLFEVAGMMGTRYRKVRTIQVPLLPGEKMIMCTETSVVTVRRLATGPSDGKWRYCIREIELAAQRTRRGVIVLNVQGLGVASGKCVFSCDGHRSPGSTVPALTSSDDLRKSSPQGATLGVLVCSHSQNIAKRRLFVGFLALESVFSGPQVLGGDGVSETEVRFTKERSTLLRSPAGSARAGKALHFTQGAAVAIGSVTLKDRFHPFCIELWVFPRNVAETQTILSVGEKGVDEVLIELDPSSDGVVWRGGARTPQLGSSFASYSLPGKLSTTERWWHVALNFSGSTWELWLDHRLVATRTALVSPEAIRNARCELGKNFVGFLAEVRVWNHTRSAAELVRDSFRSLTGLEEGLLGYYPLDERHGSVLADYSAAGQHVLLPTLGHGTLSQQTPANRPGSNLSWCAIPSFPVMPSDEPRRIADFAPLSRIDDTDEVLFCISHRGCTVGVSTRQAGVPTLSLYEYDRTSQALLTQTVLELPVSPSSGASSGPGASDIQVHGIAYNAARQSTLCYGTRRAKPDQIVLWDVHDSSGVDFSPIAQKQYTSSWDCGRDVLLQSAAYAQRFIRSEMCMLLDESAWSSPLSPLVVDPDAENIALLLRLANDAVTAKDGALVHAACCLLRANLVFRGEEGGTLTGASSSSMSSLLGPPFANAESLLSLASTTSHADGEQRTSKAMKGPAQSTGLTPVSSPFDGAWPLRDGLVRLAFHSDAEPSALLETLCQLLLSEQSRVMYVKAVAAQSRTHPEEKLLACILEYYGTLRAATDLLSTPLLAQHLYTSLLLEATFQVERSTRHTTFPALRRTSRCLEVFQEILFTRTSEAVSTAPGLPALASSPWASSSSSTGTVYDRDTGSGGPPTSHNQVSFCISYAKTLLRACEKTMDAVVRAIRKHPNSLVMLMQCLELSPVGALLPSFTVSLPFLPAIVLVACAAPMQACRGTLSALVETMGSAATRTDPSPSPSTDMVANSKAAADARSEPAQAKGGASMTTTGLAQRQRQTQWLSELAVSLTFSLCLVGCSLLNASPPFGPPNAGTTPAALLEDDATSKRFLNILRSGQRRPGTERDLLIKNLQQGVGVISKTFEELQKADPTGLVVVRDEHLRRMERSVMAAFCALLLPTSALKEASKGSLQPAFAHVLRLRPWILSKRQESRGCVQTIAQKANFLAQFECCSPSSAAEQQEALRQRQQRDLKRSNGKGKDVARGGKTGREWMASQQHAWRKMFRGWKRIRLLKTLLSSQEESDASRLAADITELLQSTTIDHEALEHAVSWRTEKARYRLSGLLLLRQLIDEARVNVPLARITLPAMAKTLCVWHYGESVGCCPSEDMFRLQGAFFQLLDGVLGTFLLDTHRLALEGKVAARYTRDGPAPTARSVSLSGWTEWRKPWASVLTAMMTSVARMSDFRKVRPDLCRAVRLLLSGKQGRRLYRRRLNGALPASLREARLASGLTAPSMTLGPSGLTVRTRSGRGTCIAPCSWLQSKASRYTYYFEVTVIDLYPGAACSVGVGAMDYSLSRMPGWDPGSYALHSEDGAMFTGSTTGRVTGMSFGAGDVVGCGWNTVAGTKQHVVYWTRNGKLIAEVDVGVAVDKLSPLVGMEGRGVVRVNFGSTLFVFRGGDGIPFRGKTVSESRDGTTSAQPDETRDETEETTKRQERVADAFASVHGVWDAFRVFTARGAMSLAHATNPKHPASTESIAELADGAGHWLSALGEEIKDAYGQFHDAMVTNRGVDCDGRTTIRDSMDYLTSTLRHCTTLALLLSSVPKAVMAPRARGLAGAVQSTTLAFLRDQHTLQQQLPSSLGTAQTHGGDCQLFTNVLTAMYHVMNLIPPCETDHAETSWMFLPLLLQLAGRLCVGGARATSTASVAPSSRMAGAASPPTRASTSPAAPPPPTTTTAIVAPMGTTASAVRWQHMDTGGVSEEGLWVALALLQQLNRSTGSLYGESPCASVGQSGNPADDADGRGPEGSALPGSQSTWHTWGPTLHDWIVSTLTKGSSRANKEVLLALTILGGAPRLAAPGDRITIRRAKHAITHATLVSFNLSEETCEVCGEVNAVETRHQRRPQGLSAEGIAQTQQRQTLPLRLVDLVVADDETSYFPSPECVLPPSGASPHLHQLQAQQVAALAKRVLATATESSPSSPDSTCLYAHLFSILSRCVARGVPVDLPMSFILVLSRLCERTEAAEAETRQLRCEMVVIEHCRVLTQRRSLSSGTRASLLFAAPLRTGEGQGGGDLPRAGGASTAGDLGRGAAGTGGGEDPTSPTSFQDPLLSSTALSSAGGRAVVDVGYDAGSGAVEEGGDENSMMFLVDPAAAAANMSMPREYEDDGLDSSLMDDDEEDDLDDYDESGIPTDEAQGGEDTDDYEDEGYLDTFDEDHINNRRLYGDEDESGVSATHGREQGGMIAYHPQGRYGRGGARVRDRTGAVVSSDSEVVGMTLMNNNSHDARLLAMATSHDAIRFDRGFLRITSNRAIGLNFTLDLMLRVHDVRRSQMIFFHPMGKSPATLWDRSEESRDATLALMARVSNGYVEFGIVDCVCYFSGKRDLDGEASMCSLPLSQEDINRWVRLSFVQSGSTLSLFRRGVLASSCKCRRGTGPMLQEDLFFGGTPLDLGDGGLRGDIKGVRLYEVALRPAIIEQLHSLNSSLSIFVEAHQCLQLRGRREGFDNYSNSQSAILVACMTEGYVTCFEDAPAARRRDSTTEPLLTELDFSAGTDEPELFTIEATTATDPVTSLSSIWRRRRTAAMDQLLAGHHRCWKGLLAHYSAQLLVELLDRRCDDVLTWLCAEADCCEGRPSSAQASRQRLSSPSPPPSSTATAAAATSATEPALFANELVGRLLRSVLFASCDSTLSSRVSATLSRMLQEALMLSATPSESQDSGKAKVREMALRVANEAVRQLLQVAREPQRARIFESTHPVRPSATKTIHEVHIPGHGYYEFFFDPRGFNSSTIVTFGLDHALTTVLAQAPGYALTSFVAKLHKVYFDVRCTTSSPQWGYKVFAMYDCLAQRRAVQTLRSIIAAAFEAAATAPTPSVNPATSHEAVRGIPATFLSARGQAGLSTLRQIPALWSRECLQQLGACLRNNLGRTRRIALACLSDLLMVPDLFPRPLVIPFFTSMHNLRHLADHQYRHRTGAEQTLHSSFVQGVTEAYTLFKDAAGCLASSTALSATSHLPASIAPGQPSARASPAAQTTPTSASPTEPMTEDVEREMFARYRLEQRLLYREREHGAGGVSGDRINIHKTPESTNLHVEWSPDRVCIVRHEGMGGAIARSLHGPQARSAAGSLIAQVPLTMGKWYYEVRIGGTGDIFIGVVPSPASASDSFGFPAVCGEPLAYNGSTGMLQGVDGTMRLLSDGGDTWQWQDYVGVVLDLDEHRCRFYVNGQPTDVDFYFGVDDDRAAAAAAATASGGMGTGRGEARGAAEAVTLYYPFFAVEGGETLSLNFGSAHFEYEVPSGCLPLDPAHLMLGPVLPYNQLRAFQDLSAHLLTGGQHPLPPFYYEEADPFADSPHRTGPAHVSLHAAEGIQVNLLDVKNNGTLFQTVRADCGVCGECWYYEVTLRTQGLMQIGWVAKRKRSQLEGAAGDDEETDNSSVGDTPTSWAVDFYRQVKWHNGVSEAVPVHRRWAVGDVVGCALDLVRGEMTFYLNGRPILSGPSTGEGGNAASVLSPMNATFTKLPVGPHMEYIPAISLRSGNQVSFNFGSSPFKHKPDGYSALGVPDSWKERMDTFYTNERLSVTAARLRVLTELSLAFSNPAMAQQGREALAPFLAIAHAANAFCQETGMNYTQISEVDLKNYMQKGNPTASGTSAAPSSRKGSGAASSREWDMFHVLMAVSRVAQAVVPFLTSNTQYPGPMTRLFLMVRGVLLKPQRIGLVDALLKESNVRIEQLRISINRLKARKERHLFRSSVFGQTFSLLAEQHPRMFQTSKRFWSTVFLGEGAEDAGGPYREHLNEMCQELMSDHLPLFTPTANHAHNTGTYRDAFVPAASANSPLEQAAFVFLGKLMGGAMRGEEPLSLFFPPLVWKFLCRAPITEADLGDVDSICLQWVHECQGLQGQPAEAQEAFDDFFEDQFFVTKLSDGSSRELVPGGANVRVTLDRCGEYASAVLHTRLHEFDLALQRIREGMLTVVPEMALLLLSPEELELRVCGQADYSVEELKKGAIFEGLTSEDRRVQFLWKALEEATPVQRRLFLRFVSGRDRLPVKLRILPLSPPSQSQSGGSAGPQQQQQETDLMLPRAATCFFAIELPDYSTLSILKDKLYYSIENCASMDTDFNARVTDENEGPHFTVGTDDMGRPGDVGGGPDGAGGGGASTADD